MTEIRQALPGDVGDIVSVHAEAFPGFFLTSLGQSFLTRFYAAVVADQDCVSLVALNEGSIVGFVVGPLHPAGFFRRLLLRDGLRFTLDALPAMAGRPLFVGRRLLRGLRYRGEGPVEYPRAALVSSIAVRTPAVGTGVSGRLLEAFCDRAAELGMRYVYLTTDREGNAAANRFYVKHGFACDLSVVRGDGRAMNRYVRMLQGEPASQGVVDGMRDDWQL